MTLTLTQLNYFSLSFISIVLIAFLSMNKCLTLSHIRLDFHINRDKRFLRIYFLYKKTENYGDHIFTISVNQNIKFNWLNVSGLFMVTLKKI